MNRKVERKCNICEVVVSVIEREGFDIDFKGTARFACGECKEKLKALKYKCVGCGVEEASGLFLYSNGFEDKFECCGCNEMKLKLRGVEEKLEKGVNSTSKGGAF